MGTNNRIPTVTRRLFLRRGLLALGASAVASSISLQAIANSAATLPEEPALQTLSAEEYRILSRVSDTIIPRGGAFSLGALDIDLAFRIDAYLDAGDEVLMQGIRGALLFLEHKAPSLIGLEGTFSGLPAEQRESLLLTLRDAGGDATAVFVGLRSLCMFYFYTATEAWPEIGYEGPLVKRDKPVYPQVES
ncbi:gluconate 2-dehydrogenase subunit 3 family protein [Neptuniibacter halophilus]|uniref:gluconate 2-dehydrogenase subunit 3 family protein n=1 Tax=Neptuniibacter halophilus TaxID=651666 RepID=UPI002572DBC3|nr:gluconate 2-dehydrogenase subunit 3 family protein [Neptuniibacter halophilus]